MKQSKLPNNPTLDLENSLFKQGYTRIIGIDEAGRGCWAGPVAVGAFFYTAKTRILDGIKDSKLVSPLKRSRLFAAYSPEDYRVYLSPAEAIDAFGIARVIERTIFEIIAQYADEQTYFLIDGRFSEKFAGHNSQIIKGDRLHYSIAAASIAAKVSRDDLMLTFEAEFPGFGFAKHKGYGTAEHFAALQKLGICSLHRLSFEPIKSINVQRQTKTWKNSRTTGAKDPGKKRLPGN